MNLLYSLVSRVILGVLLGVAVTFLIVVAVTAIAYVNGVQIVLPGVLDVWFTHENGLPAMNLRPQAVGLGVVVAVVAVGYALLGGGLRTARAA